MTLGGRINRLEKERFFGTEPIRFVEICPAEEIGPSEEEREIAESLLTEKFGLSSAIHFIEFRRGIASTTIDGSRLELMTYKYAPRNCANTFNPL